MRPLAAVFCLLATAAPPRCSRRTSSSPTGSNRRTCPPGTARSTDGGDLAATALAAMADTRTGLAALVDDTTGVYVQDDSPADEHSYRARFHFDTHDFDPGEAAGRFRTRVFIAFEEAPTRRLLAVVLRRQQGQYSLMARARRDDNSQANTSFFPLAPGTHAIEIAWRQASELDVADGKLELWIDGLSQGAVVGLQNHVSTVDFVRMGALSVKTGASGTLHWDEFESRREAYIGPCTAETCPPGCPAGLGDCDAVFADCETSLRTRADCGACDVPCAHEHGTCLTGTCQACPAGSGECDDNDATACETALTTVDNCGDCGLACTNAHGSTSCMDGACAPVCDPLWRSCDFNVANGCERAVNTLTNCGNCNVTCSRANATPTCSTGSCQIGSCNTGFGNCDGNQANGCERPLNTTTSCGGCNVPCTRANASTTCSTGTCQLGSCNFGFENCDGNSANGCEVSLSTASNTPPGENLGSWAADSRDGFPSCPLQGCDFLLSRTGVGEKHFNITALEDSTCSAYLSFRFELLVPAGIDYDLIVTGTGFSCDPDCTATAGTGVTEVLSAFKDDVAGPDDDFTVGIEVRFFGGSSCQPWTLNVYRRQC